MDGYIVRGSTGIPRGGLIVIEDGRGMAVEVWDGELWITQGSIGKVTRLDLDR